MDHKQCEGASVNDRYSLGNFEGEREVVPALVGRQLGVVERVWQEVVNQRAEREPVRPARREVLQLYILSLECYRQC